MVAPLGHEQTNDLVISVDNKVATHFLLQEFMINGPHYVDAAGQCTKAFKLMKRLRDKNNS